MIRIMSLALVLLLLASCSNTSLTADTPNPDCPKCPDCILDCTTCPPKIEYKDVFVYKYVCPNGVTVDKKEVCSAPTDYELKNASYNGSRYLKSLEIIPACIYGSNGGQIDFALGTNAGKIYFQVKEAGGEFRNVLELDNLYTATKYFDFGVKYSKADFSLEKGKLYVFRAVFDFDVGVNKLGVEYSDEMFIDAREGSSLFAKNC